MRLAKILLSSRFSLAGPLLVILAIGTNEAYAQRPVSTARDAMRAIQRKDMEQQLEYKLLPASREENASRQLALKQIGADFKELQVLNNKMMSETWSKKDIDYGFISDMVSHIRAKASRLRLNLNLPQAKNGEQSFASRAITNSGEFRAALLVLDRTIMSFVSNPLFQKPNTIEVRQGSDARRDLEIIIGFADDLKKTAVRLNKVERPQK
ncbi:MAG TPA: hypothetical protein DC047_15500 [Blastocatellia bacterium]|nr:hypothetical protein [Blastocatellia bacterium]